MAASLLSAAGAFAFASGRVTLSVASLLAAGSIGAWRFARAPQEPPGPGRWIRVEPEEVAAIAAAGRSLRRRSLRLLDPTTLAGVIVALSLAVAGGLVVRAALPSGLSIALGIASALAAATLVPIGTAAGGTIPEPWPAREGRRLLLLTAAIEEVLAAEGGGGVGPIARLAEGSDVPQSLRLWIGPSAAPQGLRCVEIGFDHFGESLAPAAIVRALPGSPAEAAIASERRGARFAVSASGDESVAIVSGSSPSDRAFLAALRRLLAALKAQPGIDPARGAYHPAA